VEKRSGKISVLKKIDNQIQHLCVQQRWRLKMFAGSGRSRQDKDARADDGADP
jgi:hypothetical protein